MLPKFASHVLHHTQRAAATAQNYALRNVLGLQNQSGGASTAPGSLNNWNNAASGSSSGWGSAGGAKYNTGSRFYQGYNGAGRAVTQANSSSAHDNTNGRTDDDEDLPLHRSALVIKSRPRPRSSSVHLTGTGRQKRDETFGVLQTVQLHQARKQHNLARASAADNDAEVQDVDPSDALVKSPRILVRRNSTAASSVSDIESLDSLETYKSLESLEDVPLPPVKGASNGDVAPDDVLSTDPGLPQTAVQPSQDQDSSDNVGEPADFSVYQRLEAARLSGDAQRVVAEVMKFRKDHRNPNVREYNIALHALVSTRQSGQPITLILKTYNEMLTRQVAPNIRTYKTMILALCERDREVDRVCFQINWRQKRRTIIGRASSLAFDADEQQLRMLRNEDNFGSAMLIFEAAQSLFRDAKSNNLSLGPEVYNALLRSCMLHSNTTAAIRVWGVLEAIKGYHPDTNCYLHLLGAYVGANDVESARDVFNEYLLAAKEGRIHWPPVGNEGLNTHLFSDETRSGKARVSQMLMWVKMIEGYFRARTPVTAIALLEEMMDSSAGVQFGPTDVPPPCAAVYSAFIRGFIQNDDMKSALAWFDRVLAQDTVSRHPLLPTTRTHRPDQMAWNDLLEALIERGMLKEANEKFKVLSDIADRDGLNIRTYDRISVFELNMRHLIDTPDLPKEEFDTTIKFLEEYIVNGAYADDASSFSVLEQQRVSFGAFVAFLATRLGRYDDALAHLERFISTSNKVSHAQELEKVDPDLLKMNRRSLQNLCDDVVPALLFRSSGPNSLPSVKYVRTLQTTLDSVYFLPQHRFNALFMKVYARAKAEKKLAELEYKDWRLFSRAAVSLLLEGFEKDVSHSFGLEEFRTFITDLTKSGYSTQDMVTRASRRLCNLIIQHYGQDEADKIFATLGGEWVNLAEDVKAWAARDKLKLPALTPSTGPVHIDKLLSRAVDEYFPANPNFSVHMAFARYEAAAAEKTYPTPDVIGRLISTFGRLGDLEKVHRLYGDGQRALTAYKGDKERQSVGWYTIEDQMIVALAHAGQIEKAHVHRQRIVDQGGNPSADAYGALIQCVRETTDDSANAYALWQESQMRGVVPNLYLYNTIISKLSRARKADYALELFQHMKANFVRPSSVTYGAVIAACCRVGDAQSAEVLFEEMTSQKNFKPRIPPYNTMIQFYAHIIRDRGRALHYFEALLAAGIQPTAHTYKLLIDCYGTIEPVDIASMEDVFSRLVNDRRAQVQGVHWAALINAWGCVQKDLGKAISIFDSIATHPATRRSSAALPDAIVYEAMMNVLVTLRRADLIPTYLDRFAKSGIHMTAYIVNLLIKGYATAGDLERAREVFENLQDPPVGLAAPNNHVTHDPSAQRQVSPDTPVYREPSTWEAMVRAELGNGNREKATALLQRVSERKFPPAVYARISGIMLEDSVSPWTSDDSTVHSA
ncbi:hypothetical protein M0805_007889 [Coniferiporia weirii]|nr:hypothetical protein M0805_007889 [Coniferiporia weirii]